MKVRLYTDYCVEWVNGLPVFSWLDDRVDTGREVKAPKGATEAIITINQHDLGVPVVTTDIEFNAKATRTSRALNGED